MTSINHFPIFSNVPLLNGDGGHGRISLSKYLRYYSELDYPTGLIPAEVTEIFGSEQLEHFELRDLFFQYLSQGLNLDDCTGFYSESTNKDGQVTRLGVLFRHRELLKGSFGTEDRDEIIEKYGNALPALPFLLRGIHELSNQHPAFSEGSEFTYDLSPNDIQIVMVAYHDEVTGARFQFVDSPPDKRPPVPRIGCLSRLLGWFLRKPPIVVERDPAPTPLWKTENCGFNDYGDSFVRTTVLPIMLSALNYQVFLDKKPRIIPNFTVPFYPEDSL